MTDSRPNLPAALPAHAPLLRPLALCFFLLATLSGCAEADLPTSFEQPPVREAEEIERPYDGSDLGGTTGDPTTDMDQGMPGDGGMVEPLDMQPDSDMTVDPPDLRDMPDLDPDQNPLCPPDPCQEGETVCRGSNSYVQCLRDTDGCLGYTPPEFCPSGSACVNNACDTPPECVDNDNDGYGANCAAGPDCDDSNRDINPGKSELCDGVDNNCNNQIDERISGVGDACTAGQGQCAAAGALVCDAGARLLVCDASPGMPTAEVCDGIDNNCDGQIDEGNTCPCGDDPSEPNDTLAGAPLIAQDDPNWNFICASDQDFYSIPSTLIDGQRYAVMIAYPVQLGDLQLRLYTDGVPTFTTPMNGNDHTGIRFTYDAASTYAVEVIHNGTTENFYRLNLIIEDTECTSNPDFFEHNDTISTATLFTPNWLSRAYICEDEDDWYYLGDIPQGTTISIETLFEAGTFDPGGDIDLQLYADPDGDNNFEIVKEANATGDDEYLNHTTTHSGLYFLRVFAYDGISNPYEIRMTR